MAYPDIDKARECHAALLEIFIHHPGGWADKEALQKIDKLARQAMMFVKDAECRETVGIVERYAAALYSEADHHRWRTTSLPGADFLRLQILRALVAFHSRVFAIDAARRNGIDPDPTPLYPGTLGRDSRHAG